VLDVGDDFTSISSLQHNSGVGRISNGCTNFRLRFAPTRLSFRQKLASFANAPGLAHFCLVIRKSHVETCGFLCDLGAVYPKPVRPIPSSLSFEVLLGEFEILATLDGVR